MKRSFHQQAKRNLADRMDDFENLTEDDVGGQSFQHYRFDTLRQLIHSSIKILSLAEQVWLLQSVSNEMKFAYKYSVYISKVYPILIEINFH